jgi:hypothetical protein
MRELTLFNVLNPGAKYSHGDLMLFLAGDGASVTSDTSILINNKSVSHAEKFPLLY